MFKEKILVENNNNMHLLSDRLEVSTLILNPDFVELPLVVCDWLS
jgi:hypothetical protein